MAQNILVWLKGDAAPQLLQKPDGDKIPQITYRLSEKLFPDD
jgi:hypothetical protein